MNAITDEPGYFSFFSHHTIASELTKGERERDSDRDGTDPLAELNVSRFN